MSNTQYKLPDQGSRATVFGAYDEYGSERSRRNGVIALILAAVLLAGIWDYRKQQNAIAAIESRLERIDDMISRPRHNADSIRILRGLLTNAQDDSVVIPSRWISNRQQALWTNIDRVDKRLRPLEQQFGAVAE